jgi:mono/diheme cytochrome c family protein
MGTTNMNRTPLQFLVGSLVLSFASFAAIAAPKTIELPPDGVQLKESPLPGYALAQTQCVACHSAEYMRYQPENAGRAYWDAMAKRMKAVFKAPINDADIPVIVDYLVKTYGNEQPK